jgi:hypothetical protein
MEQPSISRFSSQSTSRTLVGSDNGLVSPTLSSPEGSGQLQIVQTSDNKQWVDLGYLPPKILKELRREYDPNFRDEPTGTLAKGAARVKTWMRGSKTGINIRFRHKLDPERDEVTDLYLTSQNLHRSWTPQDEKEQLMTEPFIAELPASSSIISELPGEITEMPDTSVRSEPSRISIPCRTSIDSTLGEPLPRYEPRQSDNNPGVAASDANVRSSSPDRMQQVSHAHSPSQNSIVRTPTRGLSLSSVPASDMEDAQSIDGSNIDSTAHDEDTATVPAGNESKDEKPPLGDVDHQDGNDGEVLRELQEVIRELRQHQAAPKRDDGDEISEPARQESMSKPLLRNLKVARKTTYETETDAEPPSPVRRRIAKPARNKSVAIPRRRKSLLTPKKNGKGVIIASDDEAGPEQDSLLRKPTLPKRVPASAGVEAVWKSLLQMQAKILGPEHPLVYQAKSDLARSRANGHVNGSEDLVAFRSSKQRASETLGDVHPWVAAFAEDLAKLERLVRITTKQSGPQDIDQTGEASVSSPIVEAERVPLSTRKEHTETLTEDPVLPSNSNLEAKEPAAAVPRIVTSLENAPEPSYSPGRNSSLQCPDADMLWSSSRLPHEPRSTKSMLPSLILGALTNVTMNGISWIQQNYGPEQPVERGKARVRWTCSCGAQLHDDFIERRPGAARELERYLNRPRTMTAGNGTPTSPSSSMGSRSFTGSTLGGPPSSQTSWSSHNFSTNGFNSFSGNEKTPQTLTGVSMYGPYSPLPEPPWLLTCANEDRFTPKLAHLDMAPHKIRSDKDLALSLREHYFNVNKRWWRALRIRGLTTIEFVQFEVHQNRFADIRCQDMPVSGTEQYDFEPADLFPPVSCAPLIKTSTS